MTAEQTTFAPRAQRVQRAIKRRRPIGGARETLGIRAFLIPIGLVVIVLFGVPFAESVYYSFTDWSGLDPDVRFVGLKNYAAVFTNPALLGGLAFTVLYAVASTALITVFAIPLAVFLNQKLFGTRFARAVFFFPAIPSVAVLGLVWNFILNPLGSGALNTVLHSTLGLDPIPWLANITLAQVCVILVGVWTSTGWHAILYLAYLQSIPTDYYEVAKIDGSNAVQRFFYLTLPLLAPAITISTFLLMNNGLNVYALPQNLTGGGPALATNTITSTILTSGIEQAKYGQASALGVVFMIIIGMILALQLQISRRFERNAS
ncbi:carbohydrate ABC transporter permease [Amnibacterium kyonggiense]|uniref:Carbohydrate ABC transporter membrane protein 1 (CUT1 family) n=1 Tax=Amnibacterium kyonggiense TaxID=595671 RepID=A0A4R7FRH4_9MICO|nr:sugar ABC transporter permease [Amnibacterium kyonggiense]TDS80346.1 carbohydrate ABC transporter membrane protein 1 (CUT1 family) [Amnibacterium kyonggiense]